jgi:hypothetical protein
VHMWAYREKASFLISVLRAYYQVKYWFPKEDGERFQNEYPLYGIRDYVGPDPSSFLIAN